MPNLGPARDIARGRPNREWQHAPRGPTWPRWRTRWRTGWRDRRPARSASADRDRVGWAAPADRPLRSCRCRRWTRRRPRSRPVAPPRVTARAGCPTRRLPRRRQPAAAVRGPMPPQSQTGNRMASSASNRCNRTNDPNSLTRPPASLPLAMRPSAPDAAAPALRPPSSLRPGPPGTSSIRQGAPQPSTTVSSRSAQSPNSAASSSSSMAQQAATRTPIGPVVQRSANSSCRERSQYPAQ